MVLEYISDIAVSIDSVDEERFSKLRKGVDLSKVLEDVRQLVNERDKRNAMTL